MFKFNKILHKISSLHIQNLVRFRSQSPKYEEKKYVVVRVTPDDYVDVMNLFWNSYTAYEPCFIATGLARRYNPLIEEIVMRFMCQGFSQMALCRDSGEVIGACVNSSCTIWDHNVKENLAQTCLCEDTAKLLKFWSYAAKNAMVFEKCCQSSIYQAQFVMVRSYAKKQGIAQDLLRKSRDRCRELGYSIMRVDSSGEIMHRVCQKSGFKELWSVPYTDYKDEEGNILLHTPPPHLTYKAFVDLPKLYCKTCKNRLQD